jgi:hypothetical protein
MRNRYLQGINVMAESFPSEESKPRNRLPVAINFLKYHLCFLDKSDQPVYFKLVWLNTDRWSCIGQLSGIWVVLCQQSLRFQRAFGTFLTCGTCLDQYPVRPTIWVQCWNFRTIYYGARKLLGLSYRPAMLHTVGWRNRFPWNIFPWNWFLGSWKV